MRREVISELLDDDLGTPAEIASSLEDLRAINARFGGISTSAWLLRRVAARCGSHQLTMLDVAAGAGDLATSLQPLIADGGLQISPTLLDRMPSHLNGSQRAAVCGDALRLPFSDGAFDVVHCSLFAHHLEPDSLRQFVAEGLRVCRRAVLINDLIRSRLHLWMVYAGLPSFRSRLTRHDAPASVRNAYTTAEMRRLLQPLTTERVDISRHFLFRMGVLVWKGSSK